MYVAAFLPKNDRWEKKKLQSVLSQKSASDTSSVIQRDQKKLFFRQNMRKTLIDIDSIFVGSKIKVNK